MNKLILWVLVAVITSGTAIAGQNYETKLIDLDFYPVDSSAVLVGDKAGVSKINDSLYFFSEVFEPPDQFNRIVCDFVVATKDTATATGLSRDTVTIKLETRNNQDTIKIWRTIASTTKWPLASWDSTGLATAAAIFNSSMNNRDSVLKAYPSATNAYTGAATGIGYPYRGGSVTRIAIAESDSAATFGDQFRFVMLYNAAEDSLESHCILKSSSTIDILSKLVAVVKFYYE